MERNKTSTTSFNVNKRTILRPQLVDKKSVIETKQKYSFIKGV